MRLSRVASALALALLLACGNGSSSSPSSSSTPAPVDRDGDGFTIAAGDCNDQDAAVNPNGKVVVELCLWETTEWDCPRSSSEYPEESASIRVRLINNQCDTLLIFSAAVQITVREAHGTFNSPGETWTTERVSFTPNSVPIGVGGDVFVDSGVTCTNPGGGRARGVYNVYEAEIILQTSAGAIHAATSNSRTTNFPLGDEASSLAHGLSGGRPARMPLASLGGGGANRARSGVGARSCDLNTRVDGCSVGHSAH
jgi:hypothetical protein